MAKRTCKCGCGYGIDHKHKNAKFLNQKHKDRYHNWNNPRGKFAHLAAEGNTGEMWENVEVNHDPGDNEYWDRKEF